MSSSGTPDPYADPIRFGQRLKILRTARGLTRAEFGGLLGGKSASTVRAIEEGRFKVPSLSTVLRMAEILRLRDLSELLGDQSMPVSLFAGPGHRRLGAVRAAIEAFPAPSDMSAPSAEQLSARLTRAWAARHSAPDHREVVGALLPGLIQDARLAVGQSDSAAERRAAQAVLSEVYSLSQFFVAYQPDAALLWRVAERGTIAAWESEDPHTMGVAAWLTAQAHRDSGPHHYDAADAVTSQALSFLAPLLPKGGDDVLAITGALTFEAGYTAACRAEKATAWRYWDQARAMADRLPADYYHPVTSFSRAVMGAHAVTIAVELHSGPESVRQAAASDATTIPSRPRRARHRIEEARAYQLDGRPEAALETLAKAHEAAPETIMYNGFAKRIVLEEAESRTPDRRRRASVLARKLGLLAA